MIDVEAVVLDLDGGERLRACLRSIAAQSLRPARVILVDNGSRVPAASRLGPAPGLAVEIIRHEVNRGFAGGVNSAFAVVRAPFVAFVNNDAVLDPDWLAALAPLMDDARVAAVQSVIRADGATVDGFGIDISDGTYRQAGHGMPASDLPAEPPWGVSATAALFRTAALREVAAGGEVFDRRFFAYYEDVELNARLREAGWQVRLLREPKASHAGSATQGVLGGRALRLRVRNRYLVNRLHPAVGRRGALLAEDARRIARAVQRGQVAATLTIALGVAEGCLTPLARRR
jgi:GT2 family glycosyltransferase